MLIVKLQVFELDILGAALAEFRPRLAVLHVPLELYGNHLQFAVLALQEAPGTFLLLWGRERQSSL